MPTCCALPGGTVKVLVPRPLADAMESFVATARTELTSTLRDETLGELKRYFNRARNTANPRAMAFEDEEFWRKPTWRSRTKQVRIATVRATAEPERSCVV